jgi:hypothetical protein
MTPMAGQGTNIEWIALSVISTMIGCIMMMVTMVSFCGGCKFNNISGARFVNYELNKFFGPMAGCNCGYSFMIGTWCLIGGLLCFSSWYYPMTSVGGVVETGGAVPRREPYTFMHHLLMALSTCGLCMFWTFTLLETVYRFFSNCPKKVVFLIMNFFTAGLIGWKIVRFHVPRFHDQTLIMLVANLCVAITSWIVMAIKSKGM